MHQVAKVAIVTCHTERGSGLVYETSAIACAGLDMYIIIHVSMLASNPLPFLRATLKRWEWSGDEAISMLLAS